ncbi:MAG: phosphoribosylformylglycinamidine synthase I [Phycisphaerae bacterium]|nr:phosphoribosylformylglycinamidine synthase I [Phycisphaerae bacterium]
MEQVRAIVVRAAGINCDMETEHAFRLAGAEVDRVHVNRIIETPGMLEGYQIFVLPGGFSYGDDVAAGKILANQMVHHLADALRKFIDDGKLVLGICNGFQVLVKTQILPGLAPIGGSDTSQQPVSITNNDSGKYEDRWVYLEPVSEECVFISPGRRLYLPVAHGEGKVVARDSAILDRLEAEGHVAFRYVDAEGRQGPFPINPNGSPNSVAGLTDSTGRVLGLMPHPERFVHRTQHPHWTRRANRDDADGMSVFSNAVAYVKQNL